jgi:tripartite-type tricarboxylate transporter receptor subunit TctC
MRKLEAQIRCCLAALFLSLAGVAAAQVPSTTAADPGYPSHAIRIIVPFPPGGPTDLYARVIAQKLQDRWTQPVVVDNRAGGTGQIGTSLVQQSAPDGYTLLFTSNSAHVISPLLRNPRPFDTIHDFTPVTMVLKYPMYLLINPSVPAKTLAEFVSLAKSNPRQLNYSSVGIGSGGHLACELFNLAAGTEIVHVPYKGAAPAQAALVAGEVQLMCDSVGNSHALVLAGKLRGLAVTAPKRSTAVPEVPTLAEAGVPGVEAYIWLGLLGPAAMPGVVLGRLNAEVVRIMNLPDVRERVLKGGSELIANTPEQFAEDIREEQKVWARVIREKGIKAE